MKYLIYPGILLFIAASGTLALAHGPGMTRGCMQMMTGMNGGHQLPNELWHRRLFSPSGQGRGPEPQKRPSQQ
jgi:hypothetical protein